MKRTPSNFLQIACDLWYERRRTCNRARHRSARLLGVKEDVITAARVGLLVRIDALPDKEEQVAALLVDGLALVLAEPETAAWFVVRLGAGSFGIFNAFPDDDGRDAHLQGRLAAALMAHVGETIEPPRIARVDVLAAVIGSRLATMEDGSPNGGAAMHAPPSPGPDCLRGWASRGELMRPPPG